MDFQAALDCLKEGKSIQRSKAKASYTLEDDLLWLKVPDCEFIVASIDVEDVLAEDWVALV